MEGTYSIEIDAPQKVVFDFLADEKNIRKIVPNLVDEGMIEETPEKVGSTFWHVYEENGRKMKMTGTVTEHHEPTRMAVKMSGPIFRLEVRYDIEELGPNKTRLLQWSKATFRHVFKLMGFLFGKKMAAEGKKVQEENFARMKATIEAEAANAT